MGVSRRGIQLLVDEYNNHVNRKSVYLIIGLGLILLLGDVFLVERVSASNGTDTPYYNLPLCLPGFYAHTPTNCLPLGASESVSQIRAMGIPYPQKELPAASPNIELTALPVRVARVELNSAEPLPVYASLDDARAEGTPSRTIPAGESRYVAIIDQVEVDGKSFVRLESGGWVQAKPIYTWIRFQGLVFSHTPENDFGWAVDEAEIYAAPGYNSPKTGKYVPKYELIQIYQVAQADGYDWYLIGPNAWVSSHKTRRVIVDTTKPEGVTGDRWIKIDLANFTLSAYEDGELVFATLVSTGLPPMYTRPGLFQIYERYEASPMFGATRADRSDYYYLEAVPWTMYYDDTRAIHGVYWPIMLGYNQSHGCVNLAPGDANWLYAWAELGDWVYVVDPSGKTPTDPAYYLGVTAGP